MPHWDVADFWATRILAGANAPLPSVQPAFGGAGMLVALKPKKAVQAELSGNRSGDCMETSWPVAMALRRAILRPPGAWRRDVISLHVPAGPRAHRWRGWGADIP